MPLSFMDAGVQPNFDDTRGQGEDHLHYTMGNILLQGYAIRIEKRRGNIFRADTTLLHDMMHKEVEVYVDDMIVKSKDREGHYAALRKFFERIRQYRLRLNPQKCTFGVVTAGKMLGFLITQRGFL